MADSAHSVVILSENASTVITDAWRHNLNVMQVSVVDPFSLMCCWNLKTELSGEMVTATFSLYPWVHSPGHHVNEIGERVWRNPPFSNNRSICSPLQTLAPMRKTEPSMWAWGRLLYVFTACGGKRITCSVMAVSELCSSSSSLLKNSTIVQSLLHAYFLATLYITSPAAAAG